VPDGLEGERVDAAISRMFGFSRTKAAELAAAGKVMVDGSVVGKSERVHGGAWLEVEMPQAPAPVQIVAEPVEGMEIVHDDDDIVVIVKPVGVAAHPSPGWTGTTVIGGLAAAGYRISTSGAAERQGIVHRLDVGTSGLMVVAKSERAYTSLKRQFKERTVDKRYHALVQGHPDPMSGTIDAPIGRHPNHDYKWAVTAEGKPSVTHYDLIEAFRAASLLDIKLETGRTHQIRVHMSAHRHPCVGDLTYGADPTLAKRLGLTRQWLHAVRLGFEHPGDGQWVEFESSYPEDLQRPWTRSGRRATHEPVVLGCTWCASPRTPPTARPASRCARRSSSSSRGSLRISSTTRTTPTPCMCWPSARTGAARGRGGCCTARAAAKTGGDPVWGRWGGSRSQGRARARVGARWCGPSRTRRARVGSTAVDLHAQTHALGFYERLGYVAYGPEFLDAGIAHRAMRRGL
jgi:23S rRNA pseudouridine1911/1915/1917 synthase